MRLLLIADVSGKGISAAMALTLLRSTFRRVTRETHSPGHVAARMSAAFHEEWQGSPYVTGIVARIDTVARTLSYANAGHPPGILVRDGQERALTAGGPPLGLLQDACFAEEELALKAGDVYVFVTDGISEAMDDAPWSWEEAVLQSARQAPGSAVCVCDAIVSLARNGPGPRGVEDWTDDRTVVVVSVIDSRTER